MWLRVDLRTGPDDGRVEMWPHVIAYAEEDRPGGAALTVGANRTGALAWDLIEACLGTPAPYDKYLITIEPLGDDE